MSVLFGLTAQNSNEEILKTAFQKVHEIRWIPFATTGADGLPSCRTIDFNLLSDGNIYFETEVGKPIYSDLQRCPVGTLCAIIGDGDKIHNKLMLRIKALVECVDPNESIVDEFFARNPGTMSLFTKAPNVMKIFRLVLGQGELYQTYRDDAVAFLRFTFGEIEPEPARYWINPETCTACGLCASVCNHGAVVPGPAYSIDATRCLKCGACYDLCGSGSVKRRENDSWRPILKRIGLN